MAMSAKPAVSAPGPNIDDIEELSPQQMQQVANTYQQLRAEIGSFGQKQAELNVEANEHKCVRLRAPATVVTLAFSPGIDLVCRVQDCH